MEQREERKRKRKKERKKERNAVDVTDSKRRREERMR